MGLLGALKELSLLWQKKERITDKFMNISTDSNIPKDVLGHNDHH